MKATLTFTLPEESEDFDYARMGADAFSALVDVRGSIFRPARKHGYSDQEIDGLIAKLGDDATELIRLLEHRFSAILYDHNIEPFFR
jgi:hypothetical protein